MANVEVWGIAQIPHHISTGIAPSCFSLDKTRKRFDNFETKTTRKSDVKMEEIEYNPGLEMGSSTESHHSHQSSPTRKIESAVNKYRPSENLKAKAGNKVKAVSKKRIVKDDKWKDNILSRIIQLEKELGGGAPGLIDMQSICSRHEIHAVWDELMSTT